MKHMCGKNVLIDRFQYKDNLSQEQWSCTHLRVSSTIKKYLIDRLFHIFFQNSLHLNNFNLKLHFFFLVYPGAFCRTKVRERGLRIFATWSKSLSNIALAMLESLTSYSKFLKHAIENISATSSYDSGLRIHHLIVNLNSDSSSPSCFEPVRERTRRKDASR